MSKLQKLHLSVKQAFSIKAASVFKIQNSYLRYKTSKSGFEINTC